jgi:hypothetical protein
MNVNDIILELNKYELIRNDEYYKIILISYDKYKTCIHPTVSGYDNYISLLNVINQLEQIHKYVSEKKLK